MGNRQIAVRVVASLQALLAFLMVIVPWLLFPVCESPMHCYYTFMAEIGTAAVLLAAVLATLLSKGFEAPRMLAVPMAVCGLFAILYPSWLIGVCGSPKMACHYGALPVWNLTGGGIIILSVAVFFISREENV